jgi:hypothetical protein
VKKIRDESGAWIPATYKSKRYAQWKERTKVAENLTGNADDDDDDEDDDNDDDDNKIQKRSQLHGMLTFSIQPLKYQVSAVAGALCSLNTCCGTVFSFLEIKVIHLM